MNRKLVSISIPTLNSSKTIRTCLLSINNQTYSPIETIVIDSYSSDNTAEISKSMGARMFFEKGLVKQRLRGIAESRGDYMLLLDSDQIIAPDLVEKCVSKLELHKKDDALILKDISIPIIDGFIAKSQSQYLTIAQPDPDVLYGTALPRFFRALVLQSLRPPRRELGYFDHAWIYHEVVKKGAKISYVDAVSYHVEFNSTLYLARKFFKYYGHYIIPTLVEDWRLVVFKSLPKRIIFSTSTSTNKRDRAKQLLLYGVKAVSTVFGIYHSIYSEILP